MRHCRIGILLCLCLLVGCHVASGSAIEIDRSTPGPVIQAFYEAANQEDPELAGAVCAIDAGAERAAQEAMQHAIDLGVHFRATDVEWQILEDKGGRLEIRTFYHSTVKYGDVVVEDGPTGGWLTLVKIEGNWYIDCSVLH